MMNSPYKSLLCCFSAVALLVISACSVKIDSPSEPIVLQIDLNIKHELELIVEKDLEQATSTPRVPLAKKAGWIGERADGYIGLVRSDSPQEIRDMVIEVNEDRYAKYQVIAKKHAIKLQAVEKVAGQSLIKKSLSGEYISLDNVTWKKK